jgi:hypothetical protein
VAAKSLCSDITEYVALHSSHIVWSISMFLQILSSTLKADYHKSNPWWLFLDFEDLLAAVEKGLCGTLYFHTCTNCLYRTVPYCLYFLRKLVHLTWTSCKVVVVTVGRYEWKLNSPDDFWCLSPIPHVIEFRIQSVQADICRLRFFP